MESQRASEAKRYREAEENRRRVAEEKRSIEVEISKWRKFCGGRFSRNYFTKIIDDNKTNLEWLVGPNKDVTHYEAKKWARSNGNGWDLPSRKELKGLFDLGIRDKARGPFGNGGYWLWTKEIDPDDSSSACFVAFEEGFGFWNYRDKSQDVRVFAVRSRR